MGNSCCGLGDEPDMGPGHTLGTSDPHQPFGPTDADAREKMRIAAEERHRQNAVRGTQRTTPKKMPDYNKPKMSSNTTGATTDITDWS